jgi:hypothetical protein
LGQRQPDPELPAYNASGALCCESSFIPESAMIQTDSTAVFGPPWPRATRRTRNGELEIGGVPMLALAQRYGTPLYVYDERTLRESAQSFLAALSAVYPRSRVVYAAKAFLTTALVRIVRQEGLGLEANSLSAFGAGCRPLRSAFTATTSLPAS